MPDPTRDLAARARDGDRAAFDRLFAGAADRLHLFVRARLGAALRARLEPWDVVQETYVDALAAFERFEPRGEGSFVRWLCCLAESRIRALADHHGALKRRPPGERVQLSEVLERARTSGTGPVTAADRAATRVRVERSLEALPDDERLALLLRHFQGRTIDEVAAHLGRSATSVRRLLARAQERLGALLRAPGQGQAG